MLVWRKIICTQTYETYALRSALLSVRCSLSPSSDERATDCTQWRRTVSRVFSQIAAERCHWTVQRLTSHSTQVSNSTQCQALYLFFYLRRLRLDRQLGAAGGIVFRFWWVWRLSVILFVLLSVCLAVAKCSNVDKKFVPTNHVRLQCV